MLTKEDAKDLICPNTLRVEEYGRDALFDWCLHDRCMSWQHTGYKCTKCGATNSFIDIVKNWFIKPIREQHGVVVCTKCSTGDKEVRAERVGRCKLLK